MVKEYSSGDIRNIAIVGHAGTGKSTLFDSLLFNGAKIQKIGSHNDGSLVSDFDVEEKKKKMSIHTSLGFIEIDGIKFNIVDCPGHADLIGERRAAILACQAAIIVVDSVDGVQVGTEKVWRFLDEEKIPRIIFVNKMDQERASYSKIIEELKTELHANLVSLCIPIGEGSSLKGVVDIIKMKSLMPKENGSRETVTGDIPSDLSSAVNEERKHGVEIAAEGDDELIEMFLEGKEFDEDLLRRGIKEQIIENKLFPAICGSAMKSIGIASLISLIKNFMPSPAEKAETTALDLLKNAEEITIKTEPKEKTSAVVWKTYIDQYAGKFSFVRVISGELLPDTEMLNTDFNEIERIGKIYTMIGKDIYEVPKLSSGDIGVLQKLEKTITANTLCDTSRPLKIPMIKLPRPVFSYSIKAKDKKDEDKLSQVLIKYDEQYPTIEYLYNPETKESVISGMGQLHVDLTLEEVKDKYKIDFITSPPRIAYRETITKQSEAQYKHKKQSGGHGQYAEVFLRISPLERSKGFEFMESIVGGAIPKQYIPGVEKGIREAMENGVIAKYPVVDVKTELYDGSFHAVDSSELAFKLASASAFKMAMQIANPVLLEPVMNVRIYVDKQYMGDVMNDITARRGKVLKMEGKDENRDSGINVISAQIPSAELVRYSIDLTTLTQNKAMFEMSFSHYEPVTGKIAEKVIEERKKFLEE